MICNGIEARILITVDIKLNFFNEIPFGVELWTHCVLTMARHLRSGATVGGDGKVGGEKTNKKRPSRWKYDRSEICAAVHEYREGQKCVVKCTFKELEAIYNILASTIRDYFHKDPFGRKAVVPLVMGRKCVLTPDDEQKLVDYLLSFSSSITISSKDTENVLLLL